MNARLLRVIDDAKDDTLHATAARSFVQFYRSTPAEAARLATEFMSTAVTSEARAPLLARQASTISKLRVARFHLTAEYDDLEAHLRMRILVAMRDEVEALLHQRLPPAQ